MKNFNLHYLALFLLSLNYLFPLIIFNDITLFYTDSLDSEIVYNKVIGDAYKNGFKEFNIFLNGQINFLFLRRLFSPLITLYAIFDAELAYWLTDIIVKSVSYLSFFILAKKILGKNISAYLVAVLFAAINTPTHHGLGLAIMPYLIYLTYSKKELKLKHYLTILFAGLNTDIVSTILSIPFLITISIILKLPKLREEFLVYIKIYFFFIIAILISNLNLIILFISDIQIHRIEMENTNTIFLENFFKNFLINLFNFYPKLTSGTLKSLPVTLLICSIFFFTLKLIKKKEIVLLLIFYFILTLLLTFISLESVELFLKLNGITFNLAYIQRITFLFCCVSILLIFKYEKFFLKYFLILIIFFSVSFAQINSSIIPFYKKFILKENNYRNIYTFQGYYLFDIYKNIKKITKNNRTISIGLDPMIAVMNDIYVIDGYHNIYPLDYKKKFFSIIKEELENNQKYSDYYNKWGSRVYAFVNDPKNVKISFEEAKKTGAKFVISKFDLTNKNLEIVKSFGKNKLIKLYKIK